MILGVDFANYTAVPTKAQLDCWWEYGIRYVIIGCQRDQTAHAQFQALRADGRFYLEAYQYYYWSDADAKQRTERALKLMANHGVSRLWVDVEETTGGASPTDVNRIVANELARIKAAGKQTGIYTGGWVYPGLTGNVTTFKNEPLWTAAYPANGQPPSFDTFKPYGGWTRPLIWQYAGSTQLCGLNVDLNAVETAYWEEIMPEPTKPYTDEEWAGMQWSVTNAAYYFALLRWDANSNLKGLHPHDQENIRRFARWIVEQLG